MRKLTVLLVSSVLYGGVASAGDYHLKSGDWQFHEGLDVGKSKQTASKVSRTFCVASHRTDVSADWLMDLAKPRPDCTTLIRRQTDHEIRADMSCPMGNGAINGPSVILVHEDRITIDNQLRYDLPHEPLYMGQQKTVLHVAGNCSVPDE